MYEIMIFSAMIGSAAAGILDLLTTEVPDDIPALMIASGIFFWFTGSAALGFGPLLLSLAAGTITLFIGLAAYHAKLWGEADAWILAAILYMLPQALMLSYMANLVFVAAAYAAVYAIALGLANRKIFGWFIEDIRKNWKGIAAIATGAFALLSLLAILFPLSDNLILVNMLLLIFAFVFFWRYAKVIETRAFRKRVHASELKPGDVLEGEKWIGLTENEMKKLKRQDKYFTVKEGMRAVPIFPITLAVTLIYGNIMFLVV